MGRCKRNLLLLLLLLHAACVSSSCCSGVVPVHHKEEQDLLQQRHCKGRFRIKTLCFIHLLLFLKRINPQKWGGQRR